MAQPVTSPVTSPMRSLLAILVASVVLPLAIFAGVAAYDRARILEAAEESLARTADILREHALRVVEIQDLVLRQVDRRVAGLSWEEIGRSEEVHRFLRDLDQGLEPVDSIWLTAPDGVTVSGSRFFPASRPDVGHREHFAALRGGGTDLVISRAFRENATGENVFVVARRRTPTHGAGADGAAPGTFDGVVAVSVKADTLLRLYRETAPHQNHSVGLVRADGVFLIRDAEVPPPDGAPQLASGNFRAAVAQRPDVGIFTGTSAIDGVTRIVAYRKVGAYPLHILVAAGTDAVLQPWRQHTLILGLLCGGASLSLVLMTLLALRRTGRERAALQRLEQEAAKRELAEAALLQSQKLEAIGKLTGGIAHDFNNLLTAIIGSLETIRSRAAGGAPPNVFADLAGPLDIASQGANRAANLTQRLLAFARQQPLNRSAEDLNLLVEGMEPLLRRSLTESTVLETALGDGLWLTSCDPVQVETALLNLVINARDAMPGGGRLSVRTANVRLDGAQAAAVGDVTPGDYVRLSVSDTGTGMTADVLARAFDPFFTTKPVGQGTGLGLSQVYGIVRQCGGTARILSGTGEGTTVELYLPRLLREDTVTATPVPAPAPRPDGVAEADGPARILLVEDEAIVRFVAAEALREAGYEVEEAEDADSALALIEGAGVFQLMLTDVGLPGLNGRQLAEMAHRLRPAMKTVFMTGYAGVAGEPSVAVGAPLLAKPFTPDALLRKVRQTLDEDASSFETLV
ncbi:ATP-binding protein [Azospirillum canadense]|uniref:ATP-binding protein n=1 Tax=Azospirillum canadense TaxID=403962 RepID=UPI002226BCAD|nr:ATP-binding protein [Azospirillum canadense]MCW2235671.1 signal transduction histidine kinase/ActR/RegA family two-component response regulator [Azospirillum canadense]